MRLENLALYGIPLLPYIVPSPPLATHDLLVLDSTPPPPIQPYIRDVIANWPNSDWNGNNGFG